MLPIRNLLWAISSAMVDKLINFLDLAFGCQYRIHLPRNDDPTSKSRGFSCDVISNQFCKSSYLGPPCWFPLYTELYWKKPTKWPVTFYLVHTTIPNYNWVTRILAHTHSEEILIESSSVFFFSLYRTTQKGNQAAGKIVRVRVHTVSCKPSMDVT